MMGWIERIPITVGGVDLELDTWRMAPHRHEPGRHCCECSNCAQPCTVGKNRSKEYLC